MRRKLSALALALCAAAAIAAGKADISFDSTQHDFGVIKEADGKVTHEFKFANTGDAPLVIVSAWASCGCTVPTYPLEPIAPGDSATIVVEYNPARRAGEFTSSVRVKTNAKKGTNTLRLKGVIVPKK